jgi:hypothetical protein
LLTGAHAAGRAELAVASMEGVVSRFFGGGLPFDTLAHNESDVAYQDKNRRPETAVNNKREPHHYLHADLQLTVMQHAQGDATPPELRHDHGKASDCGGKPLAGEWCQPACLGVIASVTCCAVLCCAVLCCAVLCCAVLCCAVLCCACPAGMGACVSLNIMWLHADQASFKMTPAQYQDKLDSVAQLVNVLRQTDKVRQPAATAAAPYPRLLPAALKSPPHSTPSCLHATCCRNCGCMAGGGVTRRGAGRGGWW